MSDLIVTDNLLTHEQNATFVALLNTLIPPSEDGSMPGAGELDLLSYISENAPDFLAQIPTITDSFEDDFCSTELNVRYQLVEAFSLQRPDLFGVLIFQTYARYYQDDRVLEGIGLNAGPPFPRGNTVEPGDLSLLDPVVEKSRGYRRTNPN